MRDISEIERLKDDATPAKERLMDIAQKLEEAGGVREAKSLWTLIEKLEMWQNR